jgi:hypothetical protein
MTKKKERERGGETILGVFLPFKLLYAFVSVTA